MMALSPVYVVGIFVPAIPDGLGDLLDYYQVLQGYVVNARYKCEMFELFLVSWNAIMTWRFVP